MTICRGSKYFCQHVYVGDAIAEKSTPVRQSSRQLRVTFDEPTPTSRSLLRPPAIEDDNLEGVRMILNNGMDVNEPIITTGQFTGAATILVQLLVNNYKADVNATAADGTRSIHLVCFYQPHPKQIGLFIKGHTYGAIIYTLVQTNANADAEFGRDIFLKHFEDSDWCPDFGDKITLYSFLLFFMIDHYFCIY
ncbi:Protein of unknown function [Cotesia congregata]|uniref:Uncharacterized protein n=1 Tax=Cotesia congregata TaxID=51543 RepID=A0A8J2H0P6_COTCN|nr:Protein of unknown function [Cotesia congregata]